MKTHKIIFTAFAAMVLGAFVLTGCSNEEEISKSQTNNSFLQKEAIDLSKDTDFENFYILISNYLSKEKDIEQINYFISKIERDGDLSNEDMELFAQSMGHANREEAAEYTSEFYALYSTLEERYSLSNYDQKDLEAFFEDGFLSYTNYSSEDCYDTWLGCYVGALAEYTITVTGCYGLAITAAAANFWNGGIGGIVLGSICFAAATISGMLAVDGCADNYYDCINAN